MKFTRLYPVLRLLCLLFAAQDLTAQCLFTLSADVTNVSCNGGNNGVIDLSVNGGTPPFTYSWVNGMTTQDLSGMPAGTYTVTVTDPNNCTQTLSATVSSPTPLSLVLNGADTVSCQVSIADITSDIAGGTPPYHFLWSNGATTSSTSATAGTYTLTVTDASDCTVSAQKTLVYHPAPPLANAGLDAGLPCGGGQIVLDGSGSSTGAPYTFVWSVVNGGNIVSGANTLTPVVDEAGTYKLSVFNTQQGCIDEDVVRVFPGPIIPPQDQFVLDVSCTGQLGVAGVDMFVGTGPYNYLWSNGATTASIVNVLAGTYTVTVTDATGCDFFAQLIVNEDHSTIAVSTLVTPKDCSSGQGGAIDLTATTIFGPVEYQWSNGATTEDLLNLSGNLYIVTVTFASGTCSVTESVTLGQINNTLQLSTLATDAGCGGNCTGAIDLTVTGGNTPYQYFWSTGSALQDMQNLCAGKYTVTVLDGVSCTQTASATIGQTAAGFSLNGVANPSTACNPFNGSILLNTTPPGVYSYIWSNGVTTKNLTGLVPGDYTVTVTNAAACTVEENFVVPYSPNLPVLATVITPSSCDLANGSIDLDVTGGTGPFTFLWSNSMTTEDIGSVSAGNYNVTVTGTNGCSSEISVLLDNNNLVFDVSGNVQPNTSCINPNGAIDLTVTPTGAYTFDWSNGAITQNMIGLDAGTYTVSVSAGGSCTQIASFDVLNNPSGMVLSTVITPDECGANGGLIDLTVTGGSGPYTYLWSNASTFQDILNLTAGVYTVTVTDIAGCTQTASGTIVQTSGLTLVLNATTATCAGNNGFINLSVSGGLGQFSYLWSNGATTQDLAGLTAGTYTVTVTDDITGCSDTASAVLSQIPNGFAVPIVTDVRCFGNCDGSIVLDVSGGAAPINYFWSNGSTTAGLSGLCAGVYTVTVTDANACTQLLSITVAEPDVLALSSTQTIASCNGSSDGSINLSVSGGTPGYTFLWSNNVTTEDISGLGAGIYEVTVMDSQGCTGIETAIVTDPAAFAFDIVSLSNDCATEVLSGPNFPNFSYVWVGPNGFTANTASIEAEFPGLYTLTVTNQNGCTASDDYLVDFLGGGACGAIEGRVFRDENEDCAFQSPETGLAGWIVRAENATDTLYGLTDAQGRYFVGVPLGTYVVKVFVPNGLWTLCPVGTVATVSTVGDTVSGGDFPAQEAFSCPALTVSVGTNKLRRCFADNVYHISYCNQGTQDAQDAFVTVALDPFLTLLSSSMPFTDLGSNALRFDVGTLEVGECGTFSMEVLVNCNAVLGQTHCTQAAIYPDTLCVPPSANWSGASLQISSVCQPDSLRFAISNVGGGSMSGSAGYIVVEDAVMFRQGTLAPLHPGESMEISVPANGSTWRVEVTQEPFHPYRESVGLSVEACTSSPVFSTGFVNQFPVAEAPTAFDVDCTENIGSFDPNDKHSYPIGYGAEHYVRPGTEIEYLIRFQNTGTDTAFRVQILDTLSAWLDPASIRFGASSHVCRYDLTGQGVLDVLFEDILLPDSSTHEAASHGFVKFSIRARPDAPLETLVENRAAIYFDFNDPIFTNTTFLRLGEDFITVGLWQPLLPEAEVSVMPNPFRDQTLLEVKGLRQTGMLTLQVFDLQGKMCREMQSASGVFSLQTSDWPSGIYPFRVVQEGRLLGLGKLVAE